MKPLLLLPLLLVTSACAHSSLYMLSDTAVDGDMQVVKGTVLSVEEDGDVLLESSGRLVFIDMDDVEDELELGDRIIVHGVIDNDVDEGEAPEIDAERVDSWIVDTP